MWCDIFAGLFSLLAVLCFFIICGAGGGNHYRGRGAGYSSYSGKHTIGGIISYTHGQPLTVMNWEEFTVTGGGRTVYWDVLKHDYVNTVEELSVLTDYQKTLYESHSSAECP